MATSGVSSVNKIYEVTAFESEFMRCKVEAITKVEKSVGWTFDVNFCYCKGAAKC